MKVIVANIEHVINLVESHNIYFLKEQEPAVSSDSIEDPKEESLYVADDVQNNTKKQKKNKTLSKKKIIIIISAVALSAVLITSLSLGLYYGLNQKEEIKGNL